MPFRSLILACIALLALGCGAACAQARRPLPSLEAESIQATTRLRALLDPVAPGADVEAVAFFLARPQPGLHDLLGAAALLPLRDEDRWTEALDECLRLLRDLPDGLAPGDDPSVSTLGPPLVSVRQHIARAIAGFPASVRERYRERVEEKAKALLDQARLERSERPLRRLVEEHFCTHAAAEGLELLGDLALSRGDLHTALAWYARLAPLPAFSFHSSTSDGETLRHPDAASRVPHIHAKQVLALAYLGDLPEAKRQRDAFALLHPTVEGPFAGVKGKLLPALDAALETFLQSGAIQLQPDWPTLGGAAAGHALIPECPHERLWIDGPIWKAGLPDPPRPPKRDEDAPFLARSRAIHHPIIVGEQLIVADSQRIVVHDLRTGKEQFRHEWPKIPDGPTDAALAYVASAANDLAVLRIGTPPEANLRPVPGKKGKERTWLAGVDLRPDVPKAKRVRWQASVPVENAADAFFAGPPLLHQGRVWAAYQFWKEGRLFQGLGSLNPESGEWLTTTVSAETPPPLPGREGLRQPALLCGSGNLVVCVEQEGLVTAADTATGRLAWAVRYPSQAGWTRRVTPSTRDLALPVYALGRVYVAPQDTDLLLCLDAATGSVLWEREALDVFHIVGCRARPFDRRHRHRPPRPRRRNRRGCLGAA